MELGLFGDVLARARGGRRWLLFNVQVHAEFACLELNRAGWRDPEVAELVRDAFMLWQVDLDVGAAVEGKAVRRLNPSAADFMRAYRIAPGAPALEAGGSSSSGEPIVNRPWHSTAASGGGARPGQPGLRPGRRQQALARIGQDRTGQDRTGQEQRGP